MEATVARCKKCSHIYWSDEVHTCPSQEYTDTRNKLVAEAAEAEELGLVPEHEVEHVNERKQ